MYITASIDSDVSHDDPRLNWWDWLSDPDPDFNDGPARDYRPRRGIESLDDRDVFRYEIPDSGRYALFLSAEPSGVGIWFIWDWLGNLAHMTEAKPEDTVLLHHEPGTYYVEVGTPYSSEGNTGSYTLWLAPVSDDYTEED